MGRVSKAGPLGNIRGRVGEGVSSKWRNLIVIKSSPNKRTKKQKEKVLSQHLRLPTMSHFLRNFTDDIKIGFDSKQAKMPAFQTAVSYNYARALLGVFPDFSIDYKKIAFSIGPREIAWSGRVTKEGEGFRISWEIPQTSKIKLIGNDKANLIIYNVTKNLRPAYKAPYTTRADLSFFIDIEKRSKGDELQFWLFFTSDDEKSRSNSKYMGSA